MEPVDDGFAATPVELADGSLLTSRLDLAAHRIVIAIDGRERSHNMTLGPSSRSIGEEILELAASHGSLVDVDRSRFGDPGSRTYEREQAEAFHRAAKAVVEAMVDLNRSVAGEVAGPHLWPHGFDIATEWYSPVLFDHEDGRANAQVAAGWYPSDASYVYVNPWPFQGEWAEFGLPHGATWHLDGWQGAELPVPEEGLAPAALVDLARAVHDLAGGLRGR
mgnify:FL=1